MIEATVQVEEVPVTVMEDRAVSYTLTLDPKTAKVLRQVVGLGTLHWNAMLNGEKLPPMLAFARTEDQILELVQTLQPVSKALGEVGVPY